MKLTLDSAALGQVEIDLPEGFVPIENGTMQDGDLFLLGGKHNAGLIDIEFLPVEGPMIGKEISPFALILRLKQMTYFEKMRANVRVEIEQALDNSAILDPMWGQIPKNLVNKLVKDLENLIIQKMNWAARQNVL
jgi:hypothetical protein